MGPTSFHATRASHRAGNCIYNTVFISLLTYGLESVVLSINDYNRPEAFHSLILRKVLHFESTYYTEVPAPTGRTYTNQEVRFLTEQPPLTRQPTEHS